MSEYSNNFTLVRGSVGLRRYCSLFPTLIPSSPTHRSLEYARDLALAAGAGVGVSALDSPSGALGVERFGIVRGNARECHARNEIEWSQADKTDKTDRQPDSQTASQPEADRQTDRQTASQADRQKEFPFQRARSALGTQLFY